MPKSLNNLQQLLKEKSPLRVRLEKIHKEGQLDDELDKLRRLSELSAKKQPVIKGLTNYVNHLRDYRPIMDTGPNGVRNTDKYWELLDQKGFKYPAIGSRDDYRFQDYANEMDPWSPFDYRDLFAKYSLPIANVNLYRGMMEKPYDTTAWANKLRGAEVGDPVSFSFLERKSAPFGSMDYVATTLNPNRAKDFISTKNRHGEKAWMSELEVQKRTQALPVILAGEDEFVVPNRWKLTEPVKVNPKVNRVKAKNYAKGGVVKNMKAVREELQALQAAAKAPQVGFFSTLDELVQQAPFKKDVPYSTWEEWLRPGRALVRNGIQFPLKAEELLYSKFSDLKNIPLPGLNKETVLAHIRDNRPSFYGDLKAEAFAPKNLAVYPDQQMANRQLMNQIRPDHGNERGLLHGNELKYPSSKFYSEFPYDQQSDGGRQESLTRMRGIGDWEGNDHFNGNTLSWSRTQNVLDNVEDDTPIRQIEEIQSDLHQKARRPFVAFPTEAENPELYYLLKQDGDSYVLQHEITPDGHIVSPRTIDDLRMRLMNPRLDPNVEGLSRPERDEALQMLQELPVEKRGYATIENLQRFRDLEERIDPHNRAGMQGIRPVPDAPFKSPGDFGLLELKKQLLNAAWAEDAALRLTPGEVQASRYKNFLSDENAQGMKHVYDNVYASQLEKLARQYGLPFSKEEAPYMGVKKNQAMATLAENEQTMEDFAPGSGVEDLMSDSEDLKVFRNTMASVIKDYEKTGYFSPDHIGRLWQSLIQTFDNPSVWEDFDGYTTPQQYNQFYKLMQEAENFVNSNASSPSYIPTPRIDLDEEARDKIRRTGVPLWTLPAAAVGAGAAMGETEDEPNFAKGGVVKALKDLKKEVSPFTLQRVERVFDESPDLTNIYSQRGVYKLATDPSPLVMLNPGEYRNYAEPFYDQPVTENGVPKVDRDYALERLGIMMDQGGMADTPYLGGNLGSVIPNRFRVTRHEGRHRAFAIGELLGNKVATHMMPFADVDPATAEDYSKFVTSSSRQNPMSEYPDEDPNSTFQHHLAGSGDAWLRYGMTVEEAEAKLQEIIAKMNARVEQVEQQNSKPGQPVRRFKFPKGRFFKEGGLVKKEKPKNDTESAFQRLVELGEKLGIKGSEGRRARLLTMAAANVLGQDQDGNVAWPTSPFGWGEEKGVMPGIIDATTQLAALPALLGAPIPEFAERASERAEQLQNRLRALAGVQSPQSFEDHFQEGVGSMLTQLPLAGNLNKAREAATGLKSLALAPVEYLSPVVDPKAANYVIGGLGGAGFNLGLENLPKAVNWARENLGSDDPEIYLAGAP